LGEEVFSAKTVVAGAKGAAKTKTSSKLTRKASVLSESWRKETWLC